MKITQTVVSGGESVTMSVEDEHANVVRAADVAAMVYAIRKMGAMETVGNDNEQT